MNPMNAESIPSFAPVVIVTSVSGSSCLPKNGEYAAAIAFLSRGLPLVGEYWLQLTSSNDLFAASRTNFGGLYPLHSRSIHLPSPEDSQEALAEIYDGGDVAGLCRFVDNRP